MPLLKNLLDSEHIDGFIKELKFFKGSNTYLHRQTFVIMLGSILIDFCQTADDRLVKEIIIGKFKGDLEQLSKDKVVPVRLEVARVFGELYHVT